MEKEITNEEILEAMSKGFERVERQLGLLNDRVGVLEAQHKEVVTRIEQITRSTGRSLSSPIKKVSFQATTL